MMYYFGCLEDVGHYLFENERGSGSIALEKTPWGYAIDGKLAPRENRDGGRWTVHGGACAIHHKDGWTAIAFWDQSVDSRPGSNSVFLVEGIYTFEEMVELARKHFPSVMKRIGFELIEHLKNSSGKPATEGGEE